MPNSRFAVSDRAGPTALLLRLLLALALCAPAWTVVPGVARAQVCSFDVSPISFGAVSAIGGTGPVATTGTLTTTCSRLGLLGLPLPVTITVCPNLDAGSGGSSGSTRLMAGPGTQTLPYQLYQDAAHTQGWGSARFLQFGSTPTLVYTSDSQGNISATRTIYAVASPQAAETAGTYSSTYSGETFYWGASILTCAGVTVGALATPSVFVVSANVPVNCLLSVSPLNFGATGLLTAPVAATAAIGVGCTAGAPYVISLGLGLKGTSPTQRQMSNGTQTITYGLYQDAGFTTPWGDATPYQAAQTGVGTTQTLTVYGKVPAQATPSPGVYNDTVVVGLTY